MDNPTRAVSGADILIAPVDRKSPVGAYQIISPTENELILYVPYNACEKSRTWRFHPE